MSTPAVFVFPGDRIEVAGAGIRLGQGLAPATAVYFDKAGEQTKTQAQNNAQEGTKQGQGQVVATKSGFVRKGINNKLWIDNFQKKYLPSLDDVIVGTIVEKHPESYRLDINSSSFALLSAYAFEGATKRNKPDLKVGDVVYARVAAANRDMDAELTCISPHFKKEWVTGENLFGPLSGGYVISVSLKLARTLLDEECLLLNLIGKHVPFELAIGMNGRVWINSGQHLHTILIANAITNSEGKSEEYITQMVTKIMQAAS